MRCLACASKQTNGHRVLLRANTGYNRRLKYYEQYSFIYSFDQKQFNTAWGLDTIFSLLNITTIDSIQEKKLWRLLSPLITMDLFSEKKLWMLLGATAPGFNSLIPAPSVPSLISTEPVELLCRTSNISSTDPFCFVKQKNRKRLKLFCSVLFTNMRSSAQRAQNENSRR